MYLGVYMLWCGVCEVCVVFVCVVRCVCGVCVWYCVCRFECGVCVWDVCVCGLCVVGVCLVGVFVCV